MIGTITRKSWAGARAAAVAALVALALQPAASVAQPGPSPRAAAPDSAAIAAAAEAFHAALAAGDSVAALGLLADDAVVLEGGELETRAQYAAHHLAADIAFTRGLGGTRTVTGVRQVGDAAWLWATTACRGAWNGRDIDSVGAELLVLAREGDRWRLRAIHWSSRKR